MPELFPRLSHEDLAKFLSFQTSFSPSLAISNALFASSGGPEPRPRLHLHVAGVGERERQERAGDYHCRQALEDPEPFPRLRSAGRSPRLRSRSDRSVTWLPSLVSCFSPAATPRESMCCIFLLGKDFASCSLIRMLRGACQGAVCGQFLVRDRQQWRSLVRVWGSWGDLRLGCGVWGDKASGMGRMNKSYFTASALQYGPIVTAHRLVTSLTSNSFISHARKAWRVNKVLLSEVLRYFTELRSKNL